MDSQRQRLRHWRIALRHMGYDVGRQGMKDQASLTLWHRLRRPTFFTRDEDLDARHLCHARSCLVSLAVAKDEVAPFGRRLLRPREFDTVAKRMGTVVRVSHVDLSLWRLHAEQAMHVAWQTSVP